MAKSENKIESCSEKKNKEVELVRHEDMFCRKCVCYFSSKSEFTQHIQKHIEETSGGTTSYMRYIEKYVCSTCGKTFEVKSDLIIHHNTVCFQAPYTCKHCKENCENSPLLQMHLLFHHKYSEEMLRQEGFLADMDENPFLAKAPFMFSPRRKAFEPSSSEVGEEYADVENTLANFHGSCRMTRRDARRRRDIAFNLLDKVHSCEVCKESFSRKCVLDMHTQKHSMKQRKKRAIRGNLSKSSTLRSCENNCSCSINATQNNRSVHASDASREICNAPKAILKPSNAVIGSSVWRKVKPKRYREVKSVSAKRPLRSKVGSSERKEQSERNLTRSNSSKGILKATNKVENTIHKKDEPRSRNVTASSQKILSPATNGVENPTRKKDKHKNEFQVKKVSFKQEDLESSNGIELKKSGKTKRRKKYPKKVGAKVHTCDLCKRSFDDNYKLKRHKSIHTGERPFTCIMCKKAFTRGDHLKRHFKRVCNKIDCVKSGNN